MSEAQSLLLEFAWCMLAIGAFFGYAMWRL